MKVRMLFGIAAVAGVVGMTGCAAPGGTGNPVAYDTQGVQQAPPGSVFVGRVETIEPITHEKGGSGVLGTVIGGVAGGLLGHQIGGGSGQTIATIGGAVAGGLAGNQIQRRAGSDTETAYRVRVRLDDGRIATVTQRDIGSLRVGDRARVANDMATPY